MTRRSIYEHELEDHATARLAAAGHVCLKFISPGFPGVPDRILVSNDGRLVFIEFKAPGQKLKRTQPQVLKMLERMGHRVEIIDTRAQVEQLLQEFNA